MRVIAKIEVELERAATDYDLDDSVHIGLTFAF